MKQYYYFVSSLKEIVLESGKIPVNPSEFAGEIVENVDVADALIIRDLKYHFDNFNVINILNNVDEFSELGNISKKELSEHIKNPEQLPSYLQKFLEDVKYDERTHPELSLENELAILYHDYLLVNNNKFLADYVAFDHAVKNVSVAYNCRNFNYSAERSVLQLDDLSINLLVNKSPDFGLANDYSWLTKVLEILGDKNLVRRETALVSLRFDFIDTEMIYDYFGFNRILGYYLKLFEMERLTRFDAQKGREIFDKITDDLCNVSIEMD